MKVGASITKWVETYGVRSLGGARSVTIRYVNPTEGVIVLTGRVVANAEPSTLYTEIFIDKEVAEGVRNSTGMELVYLNCRWFIGESIS